MMTIHFYAADKAGDESYLLLHKALLAQAEHAGVDKAMAVVAWSNRVKQGRLVGNEALGWHRCDTAA